MWTELNVTTSEDAQKAEQQGTSPKPFQAYDPALTPYGLHSRSDRMMKIALFVITLIAL